MKRYLALDHPRFHRVERALFERRVVADCMSHSCSLVHRGHARKLDACCQYGVDVDLAEREAIVARRAEIAALLWPEAAAAEWFGGPPTADDDFPSGASVRTRVLGGGCVFLAHDGRGCAIHRAALAGGWDMRGTKPHVCRLFPLTYEQDTICLSDDYADYSCAYDAAAPTVYRVARAAVADVLGDSVVAALDVAERAAGLIRVTPPALRLPIL
jgi:Fe-S-cluster containining protein